MTPTVLTVLTNASADALSKFPLVTLIIADSSIIPRTLHFDRGPVFLLIKQFRDHCCNCRIKASDVLDRRPRKEISHEEFRHLLMLFALPLRRSDRFPFERIKRLDLRCERRVIRASVPAADRPRLSNRQ